MGAIISLSSGVLIRKYDQELLQKFQHLLPDYFSPSLTSADLTLCQKHWETITFDTISGYQQNENVKAYYDSCKVWLHSLLYHELMITTSLSTKLPETRHNFIHLMRAIVVIALKQQPENYEAHDMEIKLLISRIQSLGFHDADLLLAFSYTFLTSLQIISGREWSSQLHNSWKNVLSCVVLVCLPSFPMQESHSATSDGLDRSAVSTSSSRLTVGSAIATAGGGQVEKPSGQPSHHERMYSSQYNSVLY
jgi:hypothetical protein